MKAQRTIHAQKKTLFLMLLIPCMGAFLAATMTATAHAATAQTAVTAAACLRSPPVDGTGTDQAVQPPPTAPCDAILRPRRVKRRGCCKQLATFRSSWLPPRHTFKVAARSNTLSSPGSATVSASTSPPTQETARNRTNPTTAC